MACQRLIFSILTSYLEKVQNILLKLPKVLIVFTKRSRDHKIPLNSRYHFFLTPEMDRGWSYKPSYQFVAFES